MNDSIPQEVPVQQRMFTIGEMMTAGAAASVIEDQCEDAMRRVRHFVARYAGQHCRAIRAMNKEAK